MIRYALTCSAGHAFESWFRSGQDFETLQKAGHLACSLCGSSEVRKALMAPPVGRSDATPQLREPQTDLERAIAQLKEQIDQNSDYVGTNFASEARKMHAGETPNRMIHGEAKLEEARALIEEGVPVLPLPFRSDPKNH